ncbi:MAG TPA: class I SAM-dependent methyltransferase [Polyangiaceae bacterium]|nr:class I SAM-dependent methyltransferase [Polyangiaceae bacterium]
MTESFNKPFTSNETSGRLRSGWDKRQEQLLENALRRFAVPQIGLVLPNGVAIRKTARPVASVRLNDWGAARAYLLRDQLALFDCYLEQRFDFVSERDDAAESLLLFLQTFDEASQDQRWLSAALSSSRYFWQQNTNTRRKNLSVHYSVTPAFWLSFLTNDYPIYSHYVFEEHETERDWEVACERKLAYAMSSCQMKPGQRVLNIGEGWGGFLTYAGRRGINYTGLTLNDESFGAASAKREREGLTATTQVIKTDFYAFGTPEPFDAITNMGVTEHLTDYDALMAQYARLLKPGGYVYSDFVGVTRDTQFRSLIQKLVYPGAAAVYLPNLIRAVERSGKLELVTVHDDRLSYDKTCEAWARNVERQRGYIVENFGEARYRWIWSYLWMSVYGFRSHENGITGTRVVLRRR